jgi:hypothetical protein
MPVSGLAHPSGRGVRRASGTMFYLLFYLLCLLAAGLLVLLLGLGSKLTS